MGLPTSPMPIFFGVVLARLSTKETFAAVLFWWVA